MYIGGQKWHTCILSHKCRFTIQKVHTITPRRSQYEIQKSTKEHETPFLLYQGLNMHGDARLRKKNRSRNPTNLGGGGGKGKTTTSGCHTGQHSMMPVKHVPYFYTVAVHCARSCTGNCICSRAGVHSRHWVM